MSQPAISVVIPTYNRAQLVARAVSSALGECSDGDESIVVDDGSTDGTELSLAPYREHLVYLRVPNGGAGKARNIGVGVAQNPMDADFLTTHKDRFEATILVERLKRFRRLIANGQAREARQELRLVNGGPLLYRLIALLPGPVARSLVALRRRLRLRRLRLS